MTQKLTFTHTTGKTCYAQIFNNEGNVWDGSEFVAYATADIADYDIGATELGTGSGIYTVTVPALVAGTYSIIVYERAGGSPAETDTKVGVGMAEWSGTILGQPSDVDGLTDAVFKEILFSYIAGTSTVVDNNDGTRTITYKKQDGATARLRITFNAAGEWTATDPTPS